MRTFSARFALLAAAVICSTSIASANDRDTTLVTPGLDGSDAHAAYRQVDVRTIIGQHLWATIHGSLAACPDYVCGYYNPIERGTGFTVLEAVYGPYGLTMFAHVRLDDGRIGFLIPGRWSTEDPKVTLDRILSLAKRGADKIKADSAKRMAEIDAHWAQEKKCAAGRLEIGMNKAEAMKAWCQPWRINTSETSSGILEQWVYGEEGYTRGYLYFDKDDRLVAIQRHN